MSDYTERKAKKTQEGLERQSHRRSLAAKGTPTTRDKRELSKAVRCTDKEKLIKVEGQR